MNRRLVLAQRTLVVMAAAVAAGTALVHGQVRGADPIELVTLRSGSYADFRQVFVREAPAGVSVPATLRFPDRPRDRHPAVVVVHRITGFQGPQPPMSKMLSFEVDLI
jgi:hypothetical protein